MSGTPKRCSCGYLPRDDHNFCQNCGLSVVRISGDYQHEYTPEPWRILPDGHFPSRIAREERLQETRIVSNGPVDQTTYVTRQMAEGDARRAVACVNFCAGLPTECIEGLAKVGDTGLKDFMRAMRTTDPNLAECRFDIVIPAKEFTLVLSQPEENT